MPILSEIGELLTTRRHRPFDLIGFKLYRDGDDSVNFFLRYSFAADWF